MAADKSSQEGSGDPDQHGDEDTAGIFSRHDELGQRPNDEANDCFPQQVKHDFLLVCLEDCNGPLPRARILRAACWLFRRCPGPTALWTGSWATCGSESATTWRRREERVQPCQKQW